MSFNNRRYRRVKPGDEGEERKASSAREIKEGLTKGEIRSYVRDAEGDSALEAEKVKILALLKALRDEMNTPFVKGMKIRDFADIFIDRYNFFHDRLQNLYPGTDFIETFNKFKPGVITLEKIKLEITLLIAYIENDLLDIIEEAKRLKEKNKWLKDRIREMELTVAGIQAIK